MAQKRPLDYAMEIGPMGPIGEVGALLLRVNRNCPWNKCLFCPVYKGERFTPRSVSEIRGDIDAVRRVCDLLEEVSGEMVLGGATNPTIDTLTCYARSKTCEQRSARS